MRIKYPYYTQLPRIDLKHCVVFETGELKGEDPDEEWDRLLERHHNTRFDERWEEMPLWRLVILHEPSDTSRFIACFVWQHAIGDGHAGPSFHRTFQAELSSLSTEGEMENIETVVRSPHPARLPPNLESLHKLPLSLAYLLKMAWHDKFPSRNRALWLGAPITQPTRSRFRSFSLSTEVTSNLLGACRAHGVTMTAAIHALVALAIFSNLPSDKSRLKSSIAINLRRWLPVGALKEDEMGNYVSATYLDHRRPESIQDNFWTEAKRIKKLLDSEAKLHGKNASTGCLRWVGDMHNYFASKTGQPRDATFCLTNLGVYRRKDDDSGPWRTGRMIFSEGFDAAREAMDVTMITGEDGRLTLGVIWGDGVVEEAMMLEVFKVLKTSILTVAEHP